jgi:hypothetical protein
MCKKIEEQKTKCANDFTEFFFRSLIENCSIKTQAVESFFSPDFTLETN